MRAPFQVLVIPFRRTETRIEYAVLKRRDSGFWQFVAGGGEDRETPRDAALRETREEIGIARPDRLLKLDSMSTIPKNVFASADSWGSDIYVVPQYCFAVDATDARLALTKKQNEATTHNYHKTDSPPKQPTPGLPCRMNIRRPDGSTTRRHTRSLNGIATRTRFGN
jgi:dATP pyrophosphohydrolase